MLQSNSFLSMVRNESLTNRIIMLILLCYPALLLTVRGSVGIAFFILLVISVISLYRMRGIPSISHWDNYSIAFSLAMASPVVAIFLSQAYHGQFNSPSYDWASRFLLAIPIFLTLRRTNISVITIMQFGMPIGALIGLIMLLVHPYDWGGRYTTSLFFNLIHFSDTALMLGFLSLFSINWERKDHPLILLLKLSGFAAGIYMSIQSGERGGWVAIPLLLLLWVIAHSQKKIWVKLSITVPLVIGTVWLSYSVLDIVHYRTDLIFSDVNDYAKGNKDTSIGIRLQLYLAALHLFIEHPLFGVGPGGFAKAMSSLTASGIVTPIGGQFGAAEVHNEILEKCAETGLFGLISILSIYLVPLYVFCRSSKTDQSNYRIASFMGLSLICGFFIFGLTVEIFDLRMTAAFFSLTLAILMAAATHRGSLVSTENNITSNSSSDPSCNTPSPSGNPSSIHKKSASMKDKVLPILSLATAILSLTIAAFSVSNNQSSQLQLNKISAQVEDLKARLTASQNELNLLKSSMNQEKVTQVAELNKQMDTVKLIIQHMTPLDKKMKISPTLEEQLSTSTSGVNMTPSPQH